MNRMMRKAVTTTRMVAVKCIDVKLPANSKSEQGPRGRNSSDDNGDAEDGGGAGDSAEYHKYMSDAV